MEIEECRSFEKCDAPLCPLDKNLSYRVWYHDEKICKGKAGFGRRWVAKQRSIQKRLTSVWLNRPVGYQELFDKSRKRKLSPEQLEILKIRLKKLNSPK